MKTISFSAFAAALVMTLAGCPGTDGQTVEMKTQPFAQGAQPGNLAVEAQTSTPTDQMAMQPAEVICKTRLGRGDSLFIFQGPKLVEYQWTGNGYTAAPKVTSDRITFGDASVDRWAVAGNRLTGQFRRGISGWSSGFTAICNGQLPSKAAIVAAS